MGMMGSIVSIGSVILQSSVNSFWCSHYQCSNGSAANHGLCLAANDGYFSIDDDFYLSKLWGKRPDRIVQGLRLGSYLSMAWATFACVFLFFASPSLVFFLSEFNRWLLD